MEIFNSGNIKFKWIDAPDFHQDIQLIIGNSEFIIDSYFFWDTSIASIDERVEVRKKFSNYLDLAATTIKNASEFSQVFIPIDFSDQYFGGFRFKTKNNEDFLSVQYGYVKDVSGLVLDLSKEAIEHNLDDRPFESEIDFLITRNDLVKAMHIPAVVGV